MKFATIMADPAWLFETYSEDGKERSPEQHYTCMRLPEIKAIPVADVADDDCVLLLWAIDPMLDVAFDVIRAWGFTFKTVGFYWVKTCGPNAAKLKKGLGYWTRANPEQCLLATRGNPKRLSKNVDRLLMAPIGRHSEKPHEVYARTEALVGGPYLELFARHARPGWHQWGNQVGKLGGTPTLVDFPGYPAASSEPLQPSFLAA